MLKTNRVQSGIYELAYNGIVYRVQRMEVENGKPFWTWFNNGSWTRVGEDAYATKKQTVIALGKYLGVECVAA